MMQEGTMTLRFVEKRKIRPFYYSQLAAGKYSQLVVVAPIALQ
jgi:hypothetical protein